MSLEPYFLLDVKDLLLLATCQKREEHSACHAGQPNSSIAPFWDVGKLAFVPWSRKAQRNLYEAYSREKYEQRLASDEWKAFARFIRALWWQLCFVCWWQYLKKPGIRLCVNHACYRDRKGRLIFGRERVWHVYPMCDDHHPPGLCTWGKGLYLLLRYLVWNRLIKQWLNPVWWVYQLFRLMRWAVTPNTH